MWRTGLLANSPAVRTVHGLADDELLMGWLYVGDIDEPFRQRMLSSNRPALDPQQFLSHMPDDKTRA